MAIQFCCCWGRLGGLLVCRGIGRPCCCCSVDVLGVCNRADDAFARVVVDHRNDAMITGLRFEQQHAVPGVNALRVGASHVDEQLVLCRSGPRNDTQHWQQVLHKAWSRTMVGCRVGVHVQGVLLVPSVLHPACFCLPVDPADRARRADKGLPLHRVPGIHQHGSLLQAHHACRSQRDGEVQVASALTGGILFNVPGCGVWSHSNLGPAQSSHATPEDSAASVPSL